jgi:hypothetical protein
MVSTGESWELEEMSWSQLKQIAGMRLGVERPLIARPIGDQLVAINSGYVIKGGTALIYESPEDEASGVKGMIISGREEEMMELNQGRASEVIKEIEWISRLKVKRLWRDIWPLADEH